MDQTNQTTDQKVLYWKRLLTLKVADPTPVQSENTNTEEKLAFVFCSFYG